MSRLSKVVSGTLAVPPRIFFYGDEAVGKSTLAAAAPSPIVLDCEDGTSRIDVARYPFRDGPGGHVAETAAEVMSALRDLERSEHPYKTVVIDTYDRVEAMVHAMMLERDSGKNGPLNKGGRKLESIESYGYGKGYIAALPLHRQILAQLDRLRTKGMAVIILGHAQIRTWKAPVGDDYDRYVPRIDTKCAGLIKEWCDVVGFCRYEERGGKLSDEDRAKGYSTGRRLIHLRRDAAYDAKSRYPLPDEIEMSIEDPWGAFARALDDAHNATPERYRQLIGEELLRLADDALTAKVHAALKRAGDDRALLGRYLCELQQRTTEDPNNATDEEN